MRNIALSTWYSLKDELQSTRTAVINAYSKRLKLDEAMNLRATKYTSKVAVLNEYKVLRTRTLHCTMLSFTRLQFHSQPLFCTFQPPSTAAPLSVRLHAVLFNFPVLHCTVPRSISVSHVCTVAHKNCSH